MIVHDESTLRSALELLREKGSVRLIDTFRFTLHTAEEDLGRILRHSIACQDIAVVIPPNERVRDFSAIRKRFRRSREREETKSNNTKVEQTSPL